MLNSYFVLGTMDNIRYYWRKVKGPASHNNYKMKLTAKCCEWQRVFCTILLSNKANKCQGTVNFILLTRLCCGNTANRAMAFIYYKRSYVSFTQICGMELDYSLNYRWRDVTANFTGFSVIWLELLLSFRPGFMIVPFVPLRCVLSPLLPTYHFLTPPVRKGIWRFPL